MMTVRLVHWEGMSVMLLQKETLKRGDMDLVSMSFQVSTPTSYNYLVLGTCFCVSSFYIVHCSLFIVHCKQERAYSGIQVSPA